MRQFRELTIAGGVSLVRLLVIVMVTVLAAVLATVLVVGAVAAAEYPSGYKALETFDEKAMENLPAHIHYWLNAMLAAFAAGLAFVWHRPVARWVVGGFLATILIAGFLVPALGLQPLSGLFALVHLICWTPGLILLLRERAFLKGLSLYGVWAGVITAVILISFVFDVRDAGIYLAHMLGGA